MRFYVDLQQNHEFIAIPSQQSYTVLCKFTTRSRFLATKATRLYVNLQLNRESKPLEAQKTHKNTDIPKQSRKRLPGSHFEALSKPGWGGAQEEPQTVTKNGPREPF